MSLPTSASRTIEVDAPPTVVYDLLSDVTRTGEWSPECHSCEWLGTPDVVGSRFRGRNRSGPARWRTTAEVLAAERPKVFEFATLHKGRPATRWRYDLEGKERTTLTESFEAVSTPWLISVAERLFIRNRQRQLEDGMATTLERIKAIAEAATTA
jgi:uncharacterized protein YndB with AHSA1/START domain